MTDDRSGPYFGLLKKLEHAGFLKTPAIMRAFQKVVRKDFLPDGAKEDAAVNEPIPIGFGQTNSQPLTVAFMLELLQPQPGNTVLDIGTGSGWTAALLAELVGLTGKVVTIECIPELVATARLNLAEAGYPQVVVLEGDGRKGSRDHAPFDRIHVAAAAERLPPALLEQLASGGRCVIPVGKGIHDMLLVTRRRDGTFDEQRFPGFAFVPLITPS